MLSYTKNKFYTWCLNYNVTETNYISFILYDPSRHTPRFSGKPPSPISLEQNSLFNGRASQLDADGTPGQGIGGLFSVAYATKWYRQASD